jgi:penicillin G amidase
VRHLGIALLALFGGLVALAIVVLGLGVFGIRGSLPPLDGERNVEGINAPVDLERDSLGIAVVRAGSWDDGHFGLGFAHGQDRFFQMDLARRSISGRLAELVGPFALDADQAMRAYGYADAARLHLGLLPGHHRRALDAYVAGVNAGLRSLGRRPPEYLLLRQRPEPWTAEDALLVFLNFYVELSPHYRAELSHRDLHSHLPAPIVRLLLPETSRFDRPLPALSPGDPSGGHLPAPIPSASVLDLRDREELGRTALEAARRAIRIYGDLPGGSNAWAAGVEGGPALVASDPHLGHRVPGIWYRAELHGPWGAVRGVTLPGVPGFFVGMSDHLAWGPTAAMVDQTDLVALELDPDEPGGFRTADGWLPFEIRVDTIHARSSGPRIVEFRRTSWGPVVATSHDGVPMALRSPAFDPGGLTLEHLEIAMARSVPEAVSVARRLGGPAIGLVMGDAEGRAGWTVSGVLPARGSVDGRLPLPSTAGSVAWTDLLAEEDRPLVVDSTGGFVFTANQRFAHLSASRSLSGEWMSPTRALRIFQLLEGDHRPSERLHHDYQLDTRSLEHEWIRTFLLQLLPPDQGDGLLSRVRAQAEGWNGRAEADSEEFHTVLRVGIALRDAALAPLVAVVRVEVPGYRYPWPLAHEAAFRILEERPPHFLPPGEEDWDTYLRQAIRAALTDPGFGDGPEGLTDRDLLSIPWGEANRARISHPFSAVQPALARFLDLPGDPLPGWVGTLRAQQPNYGQSVRFVGRPGRSETAILDLPGGQSGHPLSRWYDAGHRAWIEGRGSPLEAGPSEHTLRLLPPP